MNQITKLRVPYGGIPFCRLFADLLVHCRDGFHSIPAMDDVLTMLMIEMYLYYPMRKYKVYA